MVDAAHLVREMAVPIHSSGNRTLPELHNDHHQLRRLFEKSVRGYFTHILDREQWHVSKPTMKWPGEGDESAIALLPRMESDIVLENPRLGRKIVVETKFTDALTYRDGVPKVNRDYMFQIYAYLMSQSCQGREVDDEAEGVILFAKTTGQQDINEELVIQNHRIRILSVDLAGTPDEIRDRWDQCIN
ncbi:5-methylcytosine-specific restriction enzyme subunit McrC [Dietzia cinnamea P4]|nr:5-methylcytosine-specific restriction enzyme subunit McrC [Dietzia cinnamea P4]